MLKKGLPSRGYDHRRFSNLSPGDGVDRTIPDLSKTDKDDNYIMRDKVFLNPNERKDNSDQTKNLTT